MVEALLFDLGGVVIEIDFDRVLRRWETISALSFAELKSTFHFDAAYERHERGEIAGAAAAGLQTVYVQSPDDIHCALANLNGRCKRGGLL